MQLFLGNIKYAKGEIFLNICKWFQYYVFESCMNVTYIYSASWILNYRLTAFNTNNPFNNFKAKTSEN